MKNGWETKPLGQVAELRGRIGWRGLTAKEYQKSGPFFLSVHSLNHGDYVDFSQAFHITEERYLESPEIILQKDDVLICKDGAGIGKVGIVGELPDRATINSSLLLIRSGSSIFPKYLLRCLMSPYFQSIVNSRLEGATTPHLYQRDITTFPIVVPPIEEQRRIVAILDEAFACIDKAKSNTEKNIQNARELFDSYLNNIFSNPGPDWETKPLKEVSAEMTTGPFGSNLHKSDYVSNGIPVVNPQNIVNGEIVPLAKTMVNEETRQRLSKYILKENDIILARRGEMGRCGIISAKQTGWLCGSGSFLLRVNSRLDPKYARVFLSSGTVKKYLLKGSVGATMDNLNQEILAALPVPVPPKSEQVRILDSFAHMKRTIAELESSFKIRLENFSALRASILQKAFTGEIR